MQLSKYMNNFVYIYSYRTAVYKVTVTRKQLTLKVPIPQNGQTHSNNSSVTADKLLECV